MSLSPEVTERALDFLNGVYKPDYLTETELAEELVDALDDRGLGFSARDIHAMVEEWWFGVLEDEDESEDADKAKEIEAMAVAIAKKMDIFRMKNTSESNGEWLTKKAEKKYAAMEKDLAKLDAELDKLL